VSGLQTDLLLDPFNADWLNLKAAAVAADEAGFDGVWTWDHLIGSVHRAGHVLECWTILTALAAVTQRVAIGPLVLNVANRHPGTLAVMAATLQQVSHGRLLLGLGAGGGAHTPYSAEQLALGRQVGADSVRRRQVEEAVGVLRQVWSGQPGSGFLRPDPAPPIVIGAFGPKMAELAGRVGDGINTQAQHPHLAGMLQTARTARSGSGRSGAFLSTVFAALSQRWLDDQYPERARLRDLGVNRLILLTSPPFDVQRILATGRSLPAR
jgi:alkanesulfonate monooxygenase SsuD/methylene tetrahydromethanopterin reductase-like flavin-dependent oxidoreductase (luciferase family)